MEAANKAAVTADAADAATTSSFRSQEVEGYSNYSYQNPDRGNFRGCRVGCRDPDDAPDDAPHQSPPARTAWHAQ